MKAPKLYTKKDGKHYFTFKGKQYYAGKTLEKAQVKLKEVTGIGITDQTCLVKLVGEYLDSLVGTQSSDTIYGKAGSYKRLLAYLSKRKPKNGKATPGLYSLHESSGAEAKHTSYVDAFSMMFPESIALSAFSADSLEKYRKSYLKTAKKSTVKCTFIKIQALSKWLYEKGCLTENPCAKLTKIKVPEDLDPDHLTEEEVQLLFDLVEQSSPYARVRDKVMFGLMIYAGLRRIECTRIKWCDIDSNRRVVVVRTLAGEPLSGAKLTTKVSEAVTDEDGAFDLPLPADDYFLATKIHKGVDQWNFLIAGARLIEEPGLDTQPLDLPASLPVELRIVDHVGQPIASGRVTIRAAQHLAIYSVRDQQWRERPGTGGERRATIWRYGLTDVAGVYRTSLAAGQYEVNLRDEDGLDFIKTIDVSPEETGFDLRLSEPAGLELKFLVESAGGFRDLPKNSRCYLKMNGPFRRAYWGKLNSEGMATFNVPFGGYEVRVAIGSDQFKFGEPRFISFEPGKSSYTVSVASDSE